jgi:energy-coupling factor transporter transmembrane protein EcfT
MAAMSGGAGRILSDGHRSAFPGDYRARLGLYLLLQASVFLAPGFWAALPGAAILALGARAGVRWFHWLRRGGVLFVVTLLPARPGFRKPSSELQRPRPFFSVGSGLRKSLVFLLVLAGAERHSRTAGVSEIRETFEWVLGPLPRGKRAALTAALTLSFLPWARNELRKADEAARLRGSNPRRHPFRHLSSMGIPLTARLLEKARRSSEALALRDPDLEGRTLVQDARLSRVHPICAAIAGTGTARSPVSMTSGSKSLAVALDHRQCGSRGNANARYTRTEPFRPFGTRA